ncbi:AZOBR_p60025 family cell surface glycopolymer formation protein [Leptospira dzoumogneensis]|uniref:DUF2029 domain-containing protein n=1 Tax=Leptospira dzoumogneensis TaxID=2484904 RepID=A0A4Z1AK28_9LEPT|nr:hypothetical protein [Leptospira dzoumogneensis]TGN00085.1 hypothetical protein EHR06_08175 [Leptospira dzoumogneensis]
MSGSLSKFLPNEKLRSEWIAALGNPKLVTVVFIILYSFSSFCVWKKYSWSPSSQVNFGKEFADQNKDQTPPGAIVFLGEEGNLGAGYDGQIFYYYSRMLSGFSLDWPQGFETSFRAPRIGYPLLVSPFGWFGMNATIFGMYILNLGIFYLSYLAIRDLLSEPKKYLSSFYLVSPFALGSYILLVSDTVMMGLSVLAYWCFIKKRFWVFSLLAGLAILTKEQAIFLFFPLGLIALFERDFRKTAWVASSLVLPAAWSLYLRTQFPEWTPGSLGHFFDPFGGLLGYFGELQQALVSEDRNFILLIKKFSRFPLVLLLLSGTYLLFKGDWKKGLAFRLGFGILLLTAYAGGYVLYWATYENVSRMFTFSLPLLIFWEKEDDTLPSATYWALLGIILISFLIKLAFISKPLRHLVW